MLEYRHSWGTAQDAPCYSTPCVACVKGSTGVRIQTPPPGPMLKASGMYRRSRRLCGQGRRRHEEGVVDIIRESPLTEARRGGVVDGSPGYGGGGRARPLGVEVGAGVSSTGEKSAGRARRGITLEDEGDAELNGTADDDGVGGAGGGGAGGELGYGGGGGRALPVVVEGGAGISRA